MTQPTVFPLFAFLFCAAVSGLGAEPRASDPSSSPAAAPVADPAPAPSTFRGASAPADSVVSASLSSDIVKSRFKRPAPLKRLTFSAREGFALRMVSNQNVTAEIRNGAGRTLARNAYSLQAGDWTLRPRNLAPGLYTVLLRTGPQLRSMRMKIEDSERGGGSPEWVLEKVPDSTRVVDPSAQRGASVFPVQD